jgi:hypothetical protein
MFKKFLKIIGSFFLVLVALLIGTGIWFGISSSKYTEVAKPYLEKNMPIVASWDFEKFKPLLTPNALKEFENERGQKIYKVFSKLGKLQSFEEPNFLNAKTGATVGDGAFDTVRFSMLGHFETGDAVFTVTLAEIDESYFIQYIGVDSDVFLE